MPELPEVETVVRGLRPKLEGQRLAQVEQHRPDLRFPLPENFAARLIGRRVERIQRRAKRSEEHTSELQSLMSTSYAVFCLKKRKKSRALPTCCTTTQTSTTYSLRMNSTL